MEQEDIFCEDFYNMILGGLIALRSEQKVGLLSYSSSSESLFLGKWLKLGKKQRRFPKTIATEIDSLLLRYSKNGRSANLGHVFSEIWSESQICKVRLQVFDQTPQKRFNEAMKSLADSNWLVSLPVKHDFESYGAYKPTGPKELFITEWDWLDMFDPDENIKKPVSLFVASCPQQVIDCLYTYGFILVTIAQDNEIHHHFKLYPNNCYKGKVAIPSKFMD